LFLAFRDHCAVASAGKERRNTCACGPELLGESSLRRELELQLTGKKLALELLVLADIRGNHLSDLVRTQQHPEAEVVHSGVIRDYGELPRASVPQGGNQCLGNSAQAKAADGNRLTVLDDSGKRRGSRWVEFLHFRELRWKGIVSENCTWRSGLVCASEVLLGLHLDQAARSALKVELQLFTT